MYRIRFNLGRGDNFKKWQIKNVRTKEVIFYNPKEVTILLNKCVLINKEKAAKRIFNGANKYVCSWVEFESYVFIEKPKYIKKEVNYNPRKKPHWFDQKGLNIDNLYFDKLVTIDNKLYVY